MSQHSSDDSSKPVSSYAPLEAPADFRSQIPAHLLTDASPQDKHILEALSVGAQYDQWLVNAAVLTHSQVVRTNGRLLKAEADIKELQEDKQFLKSGWKAIVAVAGVVGGIVSFLVMLYQAFAGGK